MKNDLDGLTLSHGQEEARLVGRLDTLLDVKARFVRVSEIMAGWDNEPAPTSGEELFVRNLEHMKALADEWGELGLWLKQCVDELKVEQERLRLNRPS